MDLRRRYWKETDYGRKPMSAELRAAIDDYMRAGTSPQAPPAPTEETTTTN